MTRVAISNNFFTYPFLSTVTILFSWKCTTFSFLTIDFFLVPILTSLKTSHFSLVPLKVTSACLSNYWGCLILSSLLISHFLHACPRQSCLTLCNPMDCSLPGFSVLGIPQARILAWVAIPFPRGSSKPRRGRTPSLPRICPRICGQILYFFTVWATREGLTE